MMEINQGIRGITDRPRRAPRVGKIKLGVLVANSKGKEHPQATDHFVVPEVVSEVYGDEPKMLDIIFPSNDPSVIAPYNLKQYGAGTGLKCRGDGENARAMVSVKHFKAWQKKTDWDSSDPEVTRPAEPPPENIWGGGDDKKEWQHIPCFGLGYDDAPPCPMITSKACRSVMHLQFILPKVRGFGIWQMDIGSPISISNILDQFNFLGQMVNGNIAGLPMQLVIEPIEVAPDGKRREVHVVSLRYDQTFEQLAQQPPGLLEAITGVKRLEIEAPDESDILTTVPDADESEAEAEPLDAEPTAVVDDETEPNVLDTFVIPDSIQDGDLGSLYTWAFGAFELRPADVAAKLEVEANGQAIIDKYESFRGAAGALLRILHGESVMSRFDDSPPLDGAQEPMPLES